MNKHLAVIVLLAIGLSGCATNSVSHYGDTYRDGSYYSPAREGQGDYYYAPEQHDAVYPVPYYFTGFGPSFYSYGGYCSARYRYCPSFWSSFDDPFGPMFYGAGWDRWPPIYRDPPRHRQHRDGSHPPVDPAGFPRQARTNRPDRPNPRQDRVDRAPEPRAWPREATDGGDGGGGPERGRRGGNRSGQELPEAGRTP